MTSVYCSKCGTLNSDDATFCTKCGAAISRPASPPSAPTTSSGQNQQPSDWREQRRQWRAQRRAERYGRQGPHIVPLIIATILIVAGLGILFPELPWQVFWASLLILLGLWVIYLSLRRSRNYTSQRQPGETNSASLA